MDKENKIMTDFIRDLIVIRENANVPAYQRYRFIINNFNPNTSVDVLELSVRAENALKRSGVTTFEQLRHCNLAKIRGCGANTIKEVRTKFMSYHYDKMNDAQRKQFWEDTLKATEAMYKIGGGDDNG